MKLRSGIMEGLLAVLIIPGLVLCSAGSDGGKEKIDTQEIMRAIELGSAAVVDAGTNAHVYRLVSAESFYSSRPNVWKLKYKQEPASTVDNPDQPLSPGGLVVVHVDLDTERCDVTYENLE